MDSLTAKYKTVLVQDPINTFSKTLTRLCTVITNCFFTKLTSILYALLPLLKIVSQIFQQQFQLKKMINQEKILLTLGWTSLRVRDLQIFASPCAWLNDDAINFYYEYLSRTKQYKKTLLVPASTAALILYEKPSDLGPILSELKFTSYQSWLIPINDKTDPAATGGMHWSLLFFDGSVYHHLDSKQLSTNYANAKVVAQNLSKLYHGATPVKVIQEKEYAVQENSYDCGMYVVVASEKIADDLAEGKTDVVKVLKEYLTPEFIAKKRKEIYDSFVALIKEKQK
eukprot:TRINITY_DN74152_c0_g1_i1.p1 TRINITY_DN74152_c0_g1~~TRINITY_DN74152_c0_g1_i1.p1  ORF type:complete len:284 (-),score=18.16 TRINITY_DN74152_c0_g1_i1:104-955(-)